SVSVLTDMGGMVPGRTWRVLGSDPARTGREGDSGHRRSPIGARQCVPGHLLRLSSEGGMGRGHSGARTRAGVVPNSGGALLAAGGIVLTGVCIRAVRTDRGGFTFARGCGGACRVNGQEGRSGAVVGAPE